MGRAGQLRENNNLAISKKQKEKEFNMLSLVIGSSINTVEQFSGKVLKINDFDEEDSFTSFEI